MTGMSNRRDDTAGEPDKLGVNRGAPGAMSAGDAAGPRFGWRQRVMKTLCRLAYLSAKTEVWQVAALIGLTWWAHYLHSGAFGLYEDDYYFIGRPLAWSPAEFMQSLQVLWTWPQGRPIGYFLSYLAAYVLGGLGGLRALYAGAFLVQALNSLLLYFLCRRAGAGAAAWLIAVIYVLFPADTTQSFLMHSFGLHTSITWLLLASHAYLSGRRIPAYALSLASLLTYETAYPVFLAVPLLGLQWDRPLAKRLLPHALIWIIILAAVVLVRAHSGESRVAGLGTSVGALEDVIRKTLSALVLGPINSLRAFWLGPAWSLQNWNNDLSVALGLGIAFFAVAGVWLARTLAGAEAAGRSAQIGEDPPPAQPQVRFARLALTGLIMFGLGYLFSFTHYPPTPYFGRLTSVHIAGAVGASILLAGLICLLWTLARVRWVRLLILTALTGYLALLVAYRLSIQAGFAAAWVNQKKFWTGALALLPDATNGTIVLVPREGLPEGRFIQANSWAAPLVLSQLFYFPSGWQTPPRLFFIDPDWSQGLQHAGSEILWTVPAGAEPEHQEALPEGNVIVLESVKGRLRRQTGSFAAGAFEIPLKPIQDAAEPAWPQRPLYRLLIAGDS